MSIEDWAGPGHGPAGEVFPLPFDPAVAHQARMYDYLLGGDFLNS